VSAWNNRGNAFMELKLWDRAIADFSEVIRVNRFSSDGYFGRANVYFSMGNEMDEQDFVRKGMQIPVGPRRSTDAFLKALADCDSALQRNPHDYKCFNTKGNVLKKLNKPHDAIDVFSLAVDTIRKESMSVRYTVVDEHGTRHPVWDAVEAVMESGDTSLLNQHDHRIAMAHPHRATLAAIFGNRADAWRMLMQDAQKPDPEAPSKMLQDLTRAILFDPTNPDYFRVRGYYNLEFRRWEQALSDLTRAAQLRQNYVDAIRGRVLAFIELRRYTEAWQDAKALRSIGAPLDAGTLDRLMSASKTYDYPP
jgi:tetratricopeptide (TPR) repeat protein